MRYLSKHPFSGKPVEVVNAAEQCGQVGHMMPHPKTGKCYRCGTTVKEQHGGQSAESSF